MKKYLGWILAIAMLLGMSAMAEGPVTDIGGRELAAGESVQLDLDGDGAVEQLTWRTIVEGEYGDESVELEVVSASGEATAWISDNLWGARVYAVDLDSDGRTEIFVSGDEMSDDYFTSCLHYANGALSPLTFPDVNRGENTSDCFDYGYGQVTGFGENAVTLTGSQDVLGTYFGSRTFTLSGEAFALADDGLWRFERDFENPEIWEYGCLTLKQSLSATLEDGSETTLEPGDKLVITASDKVSVAYFQTRDGRAGTLPIEADAEKGWGMKVNGISEDELFEYVPYAD